MELQVNNKYRTRNGDIAVVRYDTSDVDLVYTMSGFVTDCDGVMIREICMWTSSGNYNTRKQSQFDIVEKLWKEKLWTEQLTSKSGIS